MRNRPYVAAVERSNDSKNDVSAMSCEARHYAEGPSGVLGGAASLGSHRGAQRRAFTTLSLIVGEKTKSDTMRLSLRATVTEMRQWLTLMNDE